MRRRIVGCALPIAVIVITRGIVTPQGSSTTTTRITLIASHPIVLLQSIRSLHSNDTTKTTTQGAEILEQSSKQLCMDAYIFFEYDSLSPCDN